jgi:hypothetical protein
LGGEEGLEEAATRLLNDSIRLEVVKVTDKRLPVCHLPLTAKACLHRRQTTTAIAREVLNRRPEDRLESWRFAIPVTHAQRHLMAWCGTAAGRFTPPRHNLQSRAGKP